LQKALSGIRFRSRHTRARFPGSSPIPPDKCNGRVNWP
jgi:hypothetical protein